MTSDDNKSDTEKNTYKWARNTKERKDRLTQREGEERKRGWRGRRKQTYVCVGKSCPI